MPRFFLLILTITLLCATPTLAVQTYTFPGCNDHFSGLASSPVTRSGVRWDASAQALYVVDTAYTTLANQLSYSGPGVARGFLAKMALNGTTEWSVRFRSFGSDVVLQDGSVFVLGRISTNPSLTSGQTELSRVMPNGTVVWKMADSDMSQSGLRMASWGASDLVLVGHIANTTANTVTMYVQRRASNGTVKWTTVFGSGDSKDQVREVGVDASSGDIFAAGGASTNIPGYPKPSGFATRMFVARVSSAGVLQSVAYPSSSPTGGATMVDYDAQSIAVDSASSKLYTVAYKAENSGWRATLYQTDFAGTLNWHRTNASIDNQFPRPAMVDVDSTGVYYATWYLQGTTTTPISAVLRYDATGSFQWWKTWAPDHYVSGMTLAGDSIVVFGFTMDASTSTRYCSLSVVGKSEPSSPTPDSSTPTPTPTAAPTSSDATHNHVHLILLLLTWLCLLHLLQ